MLGLHQTHMSYSPASVAAAAAVAVSGAKTSKSTGGGGGAASGRNTSGGNVNNSHRRQQLVMAELMAQEENSIQTVRMHSISEDAQQQQQQHRRRHNHHQMSHQFVQVPPQTAQPLVVGSMPKCNTSGGGGGSSSKSGGRAATRAAREQHYHQQQQQQEETPTSSVRHRSDLREEPRHFLLRHQQRQMEADNQVVLIMSDTSARSGANGIPIIGRRLPSKSHPAPQPPSSGGAHQLEYIGQPDLVHAQQPVIGRRSHRISQRQQQQADEYYQHRHLGDESVMMIGSGGGQSVRQHPPLSQPLQPLSIIETQSAMSERVIRTGHVQQRPSYSHHDEAAAKRFPSLSKMVLDSHGRPSYAEPLVGSAQILDDQHQPPLCRPTRRLAPLAPLGGPPATMSAANGKRASTKSGAAQVRASRFASSSCLSLTSQSEQQAVLCTDPCCLQAAPLAPVEPNCMMPCCNLALAADDDIPLLRPATSQQHLRRAARRRESARDDLAAYIKPRALASDNMCQANNNNNSLYCGSACIPAGAAAAVASRSRRSSSLSRGDNLAVARDRRRSSRLLMEASSGGGGGHQRHLAYNPKMSRHQPSTPPPVPCKPNSHHNHHHHHHHLLMLHHQQQQQQQQQQHDDDSAAVTQMYESLAAELKAKLGNPNRAPILLPPKDYDTLSRQQGKLTGIELRRSTNPQLVGPHTNCRNNGEVGNQNKEEEEDATKEQVAGSGPASQKSTVMIESGGGIKASVEQCLQRSRSNSSSGLGSISLSASSPDEMHAESHRCSPSHSPGSGVDLAFASPSCSSSSSAGASNSPGLNSAGSQTGETTTTTTTAIATSHYYEQIQGNRGNQSREEKKLEEISRRAMVNDKSEPHDTRRGKGIENHNPSKVSDGILWNGRVEIPLKVNSERRNGNTYLATKQIIY